MKIITVVDFVDEIYELTYENKDVYELYQNMLLHSKVSNSIPIAIWRKATKLFFHGERIANYGLAVNYSSKELLENRMPYYNTFHCELYLYVQLKNGEMYLLDNFEEGDLLLKC